MFKDLILWDIDDMRWRTRRGGGVLSTDCEVIHRNLVYTSNSERDI